MSKNEKTQVKTCVEIGNFPGGRRRGHLITTSMAETATTKHESYRPSQALRGSASEMGTKSATLRHPVEGRLISPPRHPHTGISPRGVFQALTFTGIAKTFVRFAGATSRRSRESGNPGKTGGFLPSEARRVGRVEMGSKKWLVPAFQTVLLVANWTLFPVMAL